MAHDNERRNASNRDKIDREVASFGETLLLHHASISGHICDLQNAICEAEESSLPTEGLRKELDKQESGLRRARKIRRQFATQMRRAYASKRNHSSRPARSNEHQP